MAKSAFMDGFLLILSHYEGTLQARPEEPLNSINKDMCGAKLLPTTISVYPMDCECFCHLMKTYVALTNPALTAHPPPTLSHLPTLKHATCALILLL